MVLFCLKKWSRNLHALVINYCYAVHAAISWHVVSNRVMHSYTIIPHGQITYPPTPSHLILGSIHMVRKEHFQRI